MGNISITKLSDHVGADVIGVDLREPLSDVDFGIVLEAFHRHSVIRLRDTGADDAGIVAFSARFGRKHSLITFIILGIRLPPYIGR